MNSAAHAVSDAGMPSFRGNVGNLMQHWVFCEILAAASQHAAHIDFVDAYAMAPLADERPKRDTTADLFDCVQAGLPGQESTYERAWLKLAPDTGTYPNSATFLTSLWRGTYSMLLCEHDPATFEALSRWAKSMASASIEIAERDWRDRFRMGLPSGEGLTLLSFDPNMYDRHGIPKVPKAWNLYRPDLRLIVQAINEVQGELLIQFSTYSANNGNSQRDVIESIAPAFAAGGLERLATVRADGNMMSLIYGRGVGWGGELRPLPDQFTRWLIGANRRC